MAHDAQVYYINGNSQSQQAESSTADRGASALQMRILIELQVISMLLHNSFESTDDLTKLRQDIADSIT